MTDVMKVRFLLTDKWERTARFKGLKFCLENRVHWFDSNIKFPVYSERVKRLTQHSHKVKTVGSTPIFATKEVNSKQPLRWKRLARQERLPTFSNNNLKI